jgi:predicted transcriptional regulator
MVAPLHELEAEVMDAVWDRGEVSVRDVMEAVNPNAPRPRAYTTYMTVLARLHSKGMLRRRREGKSDLYAPELTREQYTNQLAQEQVAGLVEEFGDVALSHFARRIAELDPERREALERLARED